MRFIFTFFLSILLNPLYCQIQNSIKVCDLKNDTQLININKSKRIFVYIGEGYCKSCLIELNSFFSKMDTTYNKFQVYLLVENSENILDKRIIKQIIEPIFPIGGEVLFFINFYCNNHTSLNNNIVLRNIKQTPYIFYFNKEWEFYYYNDIFKHKFRKIKLKSLERYITNK